MVLKPLKMSIMGFKLILHFKISETLTLTAICL